MINFKKILTIFFIAIFFSPSTFAQSLDYPRTTINNIEYYIYEVPQSEGFYSLTKKFNISQSEIEKHNPETKAGLKNGQKILIPVNPKTTADSNSNDSFFIHTVLKGENLESISKMYDIEKNDIIALNNNLSEKPLIGFPIKIPQPNTSDATFHYHTIEPKETLYSISKKYDIAITDIINDNAGLSPVTFSIGRIIRLRTDKTNSINANNTETTSVTTRQYKVKKKETLYSISKDNNVSLSELLHVNPGVTKIKVGDILNIPISEIISASQQKAVSDALAYENFIQDNRPESDARVRVALLLPINLNKSFSDNKQNRYIEFYEGFLLAVDSIRSLGASIDIHVYDTETESIDNIIQKPELKKCNLIIGPVNNDEIEKMSRFSTENEICMVNPFSFDAKATEKNPFIFQYNTPYSYLYTEVSLEFIKLFSNKDIIFLKDKTIPEDKKEFIDNLIHHLNLEKISYRDYEYETTEDLLVMDSILNLSGNVLFVPVSANKDGISKLLPQLQVLKKENDSVNISLFGYPEWQMYTNEFMDYFYELNTFIYTRIYLNPFADETKRFFGKFKYWYEKDLLPIYPRYAILGFDTGLFFLKAVNQYGKNFDSHIDMISANSLQTAMCFRRINNWGGFINRCIYFVNFRPNSTIEKIEVK